MEFKIGDNVKVVKKIIPSGCINTVDIGFEGIIKEFKKTNGGTVDYVEFVGHHHSTYAVVESLELITSNKTNMNLKEKFITAFLGEPEKTFRKAGITNGDGLLTDEGQKIFLSYLLKKEGATFKTEVVDVLIAEEKE